MVRPFGVMFDSRTYEYKPVLLKSHVIKSLIEIDEYTYERANEFWNRCLMMDNSEIIAVDDILSQEEINTLIL